MKKGVKIFSVELTLWILTLLIIFFSIAVLRYSIFKRLKSNSAPAFLESEKIQREVFGKIMPHHDIKIAGSGSNLPLVKVLASIYRQINPQSEITVYESIGSSGGVKALRDGVIDIGLVSRPLKDGEKKYGFLEIPYARTIAVIGVSSDVLDDGISTKELIEIYSGRKKRWRDGRWITVFQRESSDSTNEVFFRFLPEFRKANEEAYKTHRFRVIFTDREMLDAINESSGGIGPVDSGAIVSQRLPIKQLKINGILPSYENVENGLYPYVKTLSFLLRKDGTNEAKEFVEFCLSAKMSEVILSQGYLLPKK